MSSEIFHLFPELPSELRLMIWAKAVEQDARVIEISWAGSSRSPLWFCPQDSAPTPVSHLRLVNKEAAAVYLNNRVPLFPCVPYTLMKDLIVNYGIFFRSDPLLRASWEHCPKLFFNPKVDTVYITDNFCGGRLKNPSILSRLQLVPSLQQVRSLACDWTLSVIQDKHSPLVQQLLKFPELEELFILKRHKEWWKSSRGKYKGEVSIVPTPRTRFRYKGDPVKALLDQVTGTRIEIRTGDAFRATWF
jgi:hypothetical protein